MYPQDPAGLGRRRMRRQTVDWAKDQLRLKLQAVTGSADTKGFQVLPRRCVVERTLARIIGHRRCAATTRRTHPPRSRSP
jgi:hypothetical protein